MTDLLKQFINAMRTLLPGYGWMHGETVCHNCKQIHMSVHHTGSLWIECPHCGEMSTWGVADRNVAQPRN